MRFYVRLKAEIRERTAIMIGGIIEGIIGGIVSGAVGWIGTITDGGEEWDDSEGFDEWNGEWDEEYE